MNPLSKFSSHITKSISVKDTRKILSSGIVNIQQNSIRLSSDAIKFLDDTNSTSIKRGAGGRSSYSGVTATIFGAQGFIGRSLCNSLGKCGTQMIIPYRGEHYDVLPLKLAGDLGQVLFTTYDVCDEDSIRKAVKHSNVVINLVGRDWHTRNFTMHQANAESAERIARISKEMGVKKFVHLSALNCNTEHEGYLKAGGAEFYKTKRLGEQMVREIIPEAVIFRPSDVYGQQDRFIRYYLGPFRYAIRRMMSVPNKGVDIFKNPVYIGDLVQGITNAVYSPDSSGKVYDAVGPRYYELCELLDWLHRATKRDEIHFGYSRINLKYDFMTQLKARIFEQGWSDPIGLLTTDRLERDAVTDATCNNPTLEDLGVTLSLLEDRIMWETMPFRMEMHVGADVDPYGNLVKAGPVVSAPYYV